MYEYRLVWQQMLDTVIYLGVGNPLSFRVGLQVEPEDVAVWELWSVVPRGLHAVFNQAVTVWRQVCCQALLKRVIYSEL